MEINIHDVARVLKTIMENSRELKDHADIARDMLAVYRNRMADMKAEDIAGRLFNNMEQAGERFSTLEASRICERLNSLICMRATRKE